MSNLKNLRFKNLVNSFLSHSKGEYDLTNASADFCIHLLVNLTNVKTFEKLSKKFRLRNTNWSLQFLQQNGLFILLQSVDKLFSKISSKKEAFTKSLILVKCLRCIKNLMSNNLAVEFLIDLSDNQEVDSIRIFSKICAISNQLVKKEIFQLFSGIGMYSKEGFTVFLRFVESLKVNFKNQIFGQYKQLTFHSNRLYFFVNELETNMNKESIFYLIEIFSLINCLLTQPEELKESLKIRFELQALDIDEIIEKLKEFENIDLLTQIDLYYKVIKEDEEEFIANSELIVLYDQKDENKKLSNLNKIYIDTAVQTEPIEEKEIKKTPNILKAPNYPAPLPPQPIMSVQLVTPSPLPPPPPPPLPNLFKNSNIILKPKSNIPPPPNIRSIIDPLNSPPSHLIPNPNPVVKKPVKFIKTLNESNTLLTKKNEIMEQNASGQQKQQHLSTLPPQCPLPPPPPPPSIRSTSLNPSLSKSILVSSNQIKTNLTNESTNLIMNNIPAPSKPLKSFNWQKLPNTVLTNNKNNLWSEVNKSRFQIEFNSSRLEELFSKQAKILPSSQNNESKTNDLNDMISFLDQKYTMSVMVFLKKIKMPIREYMYLIRDGKSSQLGLDNLNCLKKILPEKNDVEEIRAFCKENNDLSKLSESDKFIKELSDIKNYELRISLMAFLEEFNDLYSRLELSFQAYVKCSEELLKNESLKLFIGIILTFGNFINSNGYGGKAIGFKISVLSKLNEVKTNNHLINLLHLVVEQFDETNKNRKDFTDNLKDLTIVSNSNYTNIENDFNLLKKNTFDLLKQINSEDVSNEIRLQYLEQFNGFKKRIDSLVNGWNKIEQLKQELIVYYCEDSLTFNFDDFFRIFADLCRNVVRAREENKQRIFNEERKAKRKKELDDQEMKKSSQTTLRLPKENTEDNFDSLLLNLRKGLVKRNPTRRSVMTKTDQELKIVDKLTNIFSQNGERK